MAAWALGLLAGRLDQVIDDLEAQAAGLPAGHREGLNAAARYLTNHRDYVDYAHALSEGWPIATGVVEGTARHLVCDRLEITGARWGLAGAEAILKLRAVISNGDLAAYHTFHFDREQQRLYQARHQAGYALTA